MCRRRSKSVSTGSCSETGVLVRLKMRQETRNSAKSAIPSIPMNFVLPAYIANKLAIMLITTSASSAKSIFKRRL